MVTFEHDKTIKSLVRQFKTNENTIPTDFKTLIFKAEMSIGDVNTLKTMIKKYESSSSDEETKVILRCFGSNKNEFILKKVLEYTKELLKKKIYLDVIRIIVSMAT